MGEKSHLLVTADHHESLSSQKKNKTKHCIVLILREILFTQQKIKKRKFSSLIITSRTAICLWAGHHFRVHVRHDATRHDTPTTLFCETVVMRRVSAVFCLHLSFLCLTSDTGKRARPLHCGKAFLSYFLSAPLHFHLLCFKRESTLELNFWTPNIQKEQKKELAAVKHSPLPSHT